MISLTVLLCASALFAYTHGAAIPMWEYLSKDEKMSYLYSTFANQVEKVCETTDMVNCNHELMKHGYKKLIEMPEDHLDNMDPYQRGAHELIWDSFMDGHEMVRATKRPRPTTTAKPNSYEDQSFGDFGSASAKIDYKVQAPQKPYQYNPQMTVVEPPKGFVYQPQYNIISSVPQYRYPQNQYVQPPAQIQPEFSENIDKNYDVTDEYNQADSYDNIPIREEYGNAPLTGPMVIRVHPDGTPAKHNHITIPHDEDLKQYQRSKEKLPSY